MSPRGVGPGRICRRPSSSRSPLSTQTQHDWDGIVEFEPWLEFDNWGDRWLSTSDGEPIDFQIVQPEAQQGVNRILFPGLSHRRGRCRCSYEMTPLRCKRGPAILKYRPRTLE